MFENLSQKVPEILKLRQKENNGNILYLTDTFDFRDPENECEQFI